MGHYDDARDSHSKATWIGAAFNAVVFFGLKNSAKTLENLIPLSLTNRKF
ncbi:hypothetical protein GcC1_011026 [Golovinomyces cichoracearum]|uniref:Uncharacterized protein n=1 Tax=Golovinomyces cichoracearum TaxID=62708 RepID=A0A420J7K9_9PEZI|nr:hypothetical protein GcC1_011026 [Golovinomyces cichoracearum]